MGEEVNKVGEVKISLGLAELLVTVMVMLLSIGGSWVLVKEQLAAISVTVESNKTTSMEAYKKAEELGYEVVVLKRNDVQLEYSTNAYRESLDGLREVLAELNVTLGRMDERMQSVERGIEDIKRDERGP